MKRNINSLLDTIRKLVERHKLDTGAYALYTMDNGLGRDLGLNAYGCADAANILYSIGEFPRDPAEREKWISTLRSLQEPDTGIFNEGSHHYIHCTAHCLGALELFDAGPLHRLTAFDPYRSKEGLYRFLDELEWDTTPWTGSHKGAGLFAAMNLAGEANSEWNDWYFQWFREEADPETGFWRKGHIKNLYHCMGSSFHYLFNHQCFHQPHLYPDKMIDTCLQLYRDKAMGDFGEMIGYVELDWVYCITRSLRMCPHRFRECVEAIEELAEHYLDYLMSLEPDNNPILDDLHRIFGVVCCLAELQSFLPGQILSDKPLKLTLDRRPFV